MAVLNPSPRRRASRGLKEFCHLWLAVAVVLLAPGRNLPAQAAAPSREYQVKAVFLYNFAQFVDWPPDAFAGTAAPLVIGVLGDDPFGAYLDEVVRGESVNNRPLIVERYRRVEDIKTCHILFISRSESKRLAAIIDELKGRTILTVSDVDEFAERGGMIRFATEKGKIRLHINLDAAKAANLTISSKLLRPAEIVSASGR